jgi:putative ABC transport system permease protein
VGDIRHGGAAQPARPEIYQAFAQAPVPYLALVVRAGSGSAASVVAGVRAAVTTIDSSLPVHDVRRMRDIVLGSIAQPRFLMRTVDLFAIAALLLSAVGLYGVIAQSVTTRRREFAIRLALGAHPRSILGMVIGRGLTQALAGIAIGAIGAAALTRLLTTMLFGVSATDPATFAIVCAAMLGVAAFASWLPARRAMRVQPRSALDAD